MLTLTLSALQGLCDGRVGGNTAGHYWRVVLGVAVWLLETEQAVQRLCRLRVLDGARSFTDHITHLTRSSTQLGRCKH